MCKKILIAFISISFQNNIYGTSDDPLLARAEAAAMQDISKSSSYHHLGLMKPDSLYGHSGEIPMHHNGSRHQMPLHSFGTSGGGGESMLDQLTSVSMPLSGYTPDHGSIASSQAQTAQMYNPAYSHTNVNQMCNSMQQMSSGSSVAAAAAAAVAHSSMAMSPHTNMPQTTHHDLDCDPRELEAFSEHFKQRRIKLGVTQCDVGSALGKLKIPGVGSLSQSTICRFESLTLSHNNMIALKPVLQAWLEEAEAKAREQKLLEDPTLSDKKKKRTSITAAEKRSLEAYFAIQPRPSGEKISQIAEKLGLKKSVVRVWFCNQRQKQKRMKFSSVTMQGPHVPQVPQLSR